MKNNPIKIGDYFANSHCNNDGIAIIGMSGRFPGAKTLEEFWENLSNGTCSIKFFDKTSLLNSGIAEDILNHPNFVAAGGIVEDIDQFDEKFFGYLPLEASVLDPQHRMFLEVTHEALENAGYTAKKYEGSMGVFVGTGESSYFTNYIVPNKKVIELFGLWESKIATTPNLLANRIAYKLNLKGPALNINTACSTSLVSVVTACENLENFKCDIAIAGGIYLMMPNEFGYIFREGGILSPEGICRTFDKKAAGTVPGSGAGVVILKRLRDAIADGDNILASIRGFAVNNDGSNKAGFTAPSVEGQRECIRQALQKGKIPPNSISYIEAHGTATQLGDVIELQALKEVFAKESFSSYSCALGSVKPNIGHADIASGIIGLIKVILCIKNKTLVPHIGTQHNLQTRELRDSPFIINTQKLSWKSTAENTPLRAGVSSFGIGGTNSHIIVEQVTQHYQQRPKDIDKTYIFCCSAKTSSSLACLQHKILRYMKSNKGENFEDLIYTLHMGREDHSLRVAFPCKDFEDAIQQLEKNVANRSKEIQNDPENEGVVFMFPGQITCYANVIEKLYRDEESFKFKIDDCCDEINKIYNINIYNYLFERNFNTCKNNTTDTLRDQLSIFVIEYSLASLIIHWGITPTAMIGHSLGEYVAACLSGVITLSEALKLIFWRGTFMKQSESGSMLAVKLSQREILPFIDKNIALAAVNAPSECVVSGKSKAIELLMQKFGAHDIQYKQLRTEFAFHSSMMADSAKKFEEILKKVEFKEPQIPYVSNVTGTWVTYDEIKNTDYWVNHLCKTVKFSTGVRTLQKCGKYAYLEVGPGSVLCSLVNLQRPNALFNSAIPILRKSAQVFEIYSGLAELWRQGANIDWAAFYGDQKKKRIPLPTYPFETKRHWISSTQKDTCFRSKKTKEKHQIFNSPKLDEVVTSGQEVYNETEEILVKIWEGVFGIETISVFNDFFELGGNSLTAIQMTSIIREKFDIELQISKFFENSTIRKLADVVAEIRSKEIAKLLPPIVAHTTNFAPASFIQEQFWFLDQLAGKTTLHNLSTTFQLNGVINFTAMCISLANLIKRHKVLGSSIKLENGKIIQEFNENFTLNSQVDHHDLSKLPAKKQNYKFKKLLSAEIAKPFDLSKGPMIRIQAISTNIEQHTLTFSVHHAACDGWSLNILFKEFSELYNSYIKKRTANLPKLHVQYSDFAIWQRDVIPQKLINDQLAYWEKKLGNAPDRIKLPFIKDRPQKKSHQGSFHYFSAPQDILKKIKMICVANDVTFFMYMLAAFSIILHERCKQNDLIIGTPIANRHYTHTENLIGCFLNMLALRVNYHDNNISFVDLLRQVRQVTLEAYENRDVPFRKVVNHLQIDRNLSYNPIFQTCMYIQTNDATLFNLEGTKSKVRTQATSSGELQTSKFDLTLWIQEEESLSLGFEYASDLFKKEDIIRMANDFINLLYFTTDNPNQTISTIELTLSNHLNNDIRGKNHVI